jgi:hypothetical protein
MFKDIYILNSDISYKNEPNLSHLVQCNIISELLKLTKTRTKCIVKGFVKGYNFIPTLVKKICGKNSTST